MSKDGQIFSKLDRSVKTKVILGNGLIVQAQGRGSAAIYTKQGIKYIHDVLFIPYLAQNLLSVAQMLSNGYSLSFKGHLYFIYDSHDCLIAKFSMVDRSFPLNWNYVWDTMNYASKDGSFLWHRRYGHFSLVTVKSMQSQGLTRDFVIPENFG